MKKLLYLLILVFAVAMVSCVEDENPPILNVQPDLDYSEASGDM